MSHVNGVKFCYLCGCSFPFERYKLGYKTCTECGEAAARKEAERRKSCVAPVYNKGAYQYVGDVQAARDAGKK